MVVSSPSTVINNSLFPLPSLSLHPPTPLPSPPQYSCQEDTKRLRSSINGEDALVVCPTLAEWLSADTNSTLLAANLDVSRARYLNETAKSGKIKVGKNAKRTTSNTSPPHRPTAPPPHRPTARPPPPL